MRREIVLGDRRVVYDLQRKNVKNINLRIRRDGSVTVSAGRNVPVGAIEHFIVSNSDFIRKALSRCAEEAGNVPKPKQYTDGELHTVFGRDRILKVLQGKQNCIEYNDAFITLTVTDPSDAALKRKCMEQWMDSLCRETILSLCRAVYPKFQPCGIAFPQIRFRKMVSRWGSCQTVKRILTFNTALIFVPVSCIEYVVVHEFTHFLQPDHSPEFYRKMAVFLPDWKERKQLLADQRIP